MPRRPLDEELDREDMQQRGPELKSRRRKPIRSEEGVVHDAREGVREDAREDARPGFAPRS